MTITTEDFLTFCDRTIGFHIGVAQRLGDDLVNIAPTLPGANTPFQLSTHALSACLYWVDHIVCGHPTARERDAEFESTGSVADLHDQASTLRSRLRELAPEINAATQLAHAARTSTPLLGDWTVGAALVHAYEELAQHLGHLELTADLVLAASDR
jgi:hypothetical protein